MMDHGVLQCVRSDLKRTADGIVRPESMSRSNMNATQTRYNKAVCTYQDHKNRGKNAAQNLPNVKAHKKEYDSFSFGMRFDPTYFVDWIPSVEYCSAIADNNNRINLPERIVSSRDKWNDRSENEGSHDVVLLILCDRNSKDKDEAKV